MRKIFGVAFSLSLFVASAALFIFRQEAIDWWRLRGYEPSPAVARLADEASLNASGRKLFYLHDPDLLSKPDFQGKCPSGEETIVLGCYITHTKIYVFDVDNERLQGVEEVTAAHEMLHAAFDRLPTEEKERVSRLLEQTFTSSDDARLRETIETYQRRDPSVIANELHSIIGTELRNIPAELEDYYRRYFVDRLAVVAKAEAYASEFTKLEEQIASYDAQLKVLSDQIKSAQSDIAQLNVALETEQQQLEAQRSNPDAYNASVPGYNDKVREYNTKVQALRSLIDRFNGLVSERNAIAVEERGLVEAIDTRQRDTQQ